MTPEPVPTPQPTVLVVDDEWLIRWAVGQKLAAAGYRVVEAPDADAAMRHFDGVPHRIDVVLLDLKLPDGDGLSVLRQIKAKQPSCPVIMMTAHGSDDTDREAQALGAVETLHKPFDDARLLALLRAALGPPH